jgi:hypothetical protein
MAQAGLEFGNPLDPLVPAPISPAGSGSGSAFLQQSLADIAVIGEQALQQVPMRAPQVAPQSAPSIAFSPSTKQFFVQGRMFSQDDAQSALESEALLGQPGTAAPQGGDWVPVDPQSYAGYLQGIKNPGLGTLFAKGFGRGIDTTQLLIGRGLQLAGAEKFGGDIVRQQVEDLRRTEPYSRRFSDIQGGGDAIEWFVANLGEQSPMLLEGVLTGGLGAIAGSTVARVGAGVALRQTLRKRAEGIALDAAEQKLVRYAAGGAIAASLGSNYATGAADIYGEFRDQGADANDAQARVSALLGAVPYALFESAPEVALGARVLKGFGAPKALAAGASLKRRGAELLRRGAVGGAIGGVAEGTTEAGQEALLLGLTGQDFSKPENVTRLIDSFAAGAALGGPVGAVFNLGGKEPADLLSGSTEGVLVGEPYGGGPSVLTLRNRANQLPAVVPPRVAGTALGPAVEQVEGTPYTPRTDISGLVSGPQQQLMLPPPGAVLQVQGQPDFVVDEDGNIRAATPEDVVVGISDRGFVPATVPGTQGVLDVFPGSQTTVRELGGMMQPPAAAPTTLLQPEGVTGEVPTAAPDLNQGVLPFESGLAPRYMAQPAPPSGTLADNAQLREFLERQQQAQLSAQRQAALQQAQGAVPPTPEVGALDQRLAESQPFLDVMGTKGRLTPEPQYGVTEDDAEAQWSKTKSGVHRRSWATLRPFFRDQWIVALNGNYSPSDLKQIKIDIAKAEAFARRKPKEPLRVVVTGDISPAVSLTDEVIQDVRAAQREGIITEREADYFTAELIASRGKGLVAQIETRDFTLAALQKARENAQKRTSRAAKESKASALAKGKQTRAAPAGATKPAARPAPARTRTTKTQEPRKAPTVTVQDVKADPQYKPTKAALDAAIKDGTITGRARIELLVELNKGEFELVADEIASKRAAAKKAAPKVAATPAPKAAALKKGKPELDYAAVREELTDAVDNNIISQDQYDTLIAGVDRKTSTPDRIKAQLDYLIRGGTIKKVAPGEAYGLRAKETEVVREQAPTETAQDLSATDADYRDLNLDVDAALKAKEIQPLQARVLKDMNAARKPLGEIRRALIGMTASNKAMVRERIGDTVGDGISVAEAEAAVRRVAGAWKTQTKTKVWKDFESVPEGLRMQLSGPTVLGFYDTETNTVHVIAGNHLSGSEVVATIYHEILGHRGLRDRFGARVLSILNAIYRTNAEVRKSADEYLKRTGKWKGNPDAGALAVEEVLAMASESGRFQASLWQRLVNLVREFGRRVGFSITYNNADVATILAMAHDSVIEGTGRVKGLMRMASDSSLMERQARVDELVNGLPASLRDPVRTITDTFAGIGTRTVSRFGLMNQLIDLAVRKGINSARRFARLSRERGAIVERQQQDFVKWAEDHAALPAKERGVGADTVNGLIEAMTRQQSWAFDPDYFTGDDKGTKITLDDDLVQWYQSMSPAAQKSVREAFRLNYNSLKQMQEAVITATETEYDALIEGAPDAAEKNKLREAKANSLTQFRTLLNIEPTRPYAPLTRYGDWVVVGRSQELLDAMEGGDYKLINKLEQDERHYYVDFADTRAEAAKMQREIQSVYGSAPDNTELFLKNQARDDMFGGRDMMYAFQRLNSVIEAEGLNPALSRQLRQTATQLQLQVMAASSARKGELRRKNIASGDLDMVKAILSRGRASAHFVGAVYKNSEILDAMRQMDREVKARGGGREDRQAIYNGIVARYVDGLQSKVQNTLADTLTSYTSVWMLGFSPSYYIQQGLQNLMLTLPEMAARHGYTDSLRALRTGYGQVMQAWDGSRLTEQLDINKVDPKYRALAMFLAESGELDVGINKEMGLITSDGDGFISNTFKRVMDRIRGLTRKIEAINRLSAGIAMYDLELSSARGTPPTYDADAYRSYVKDFRKAHPDMSPMTERQFAAANAAMRLITDTHGNYSMENAPVFLRGTLGRVIGQFQKFRIMLAGLYVREFYNAFRDPSLSPEERRVARRALMFLSGHAAIAGGLIGSPAAAVFMLVYNMLSGDDEERGDLERDIRQAVGDDTLANLLLRGVPTLFGVDVSGTLGQGNLLSVAPYAELPSDRDTYAKYILSLTGPAIGGVGANAADAMALLSDGNYYKALEKLMPRGIGAASKSLREAVTGETAMSGDVLTQPIDMGAVEALWGTLGLAPISRVNRMFARDQFYKDEKFYQERASDIKRAYTDASKSKDNGAMTALKLEWKGLQAARRERGFKVQPVLDLVKAPREQAKREKQTVGGIPFTTGTERRAKQIAETAGTAR